LAATGNEHICVQQTRTLAPKMLLLLLLTADWFVAKKDVRGTIQHIKRERGRKMATVVATVN